MNYEQTKHFLGSFVSDLEVSKAYVDKEDVVNRIVDYIRNQGLDVDDQYINFVQNYDLSMVKIDVKYIPVYYINAIGRIYFKDTEDGSENQDFIKFSTLFYANEENKNNRINDLEILRIIDKKAIKNAKKEALVAITTKLDGDVKLLGTDEKFERQIILDAPLGENDLYPIELSYMLSEEKVNRHAENALRETNAYKKLSKVGEKMSKIEQMKVEVVLVPVAKFSLGNHDQYVNCGNGVVNCKYEKSKRITRNLNKAKWMTIPTIVSFFALGITTFILKWNKPQTFLDLPKLFLGNMYDILWLILVVTGLVLAFFSIPQRAKIVRRANSNKDQLRTSRILTRLLVDVSIALLILLLTMFPL